MVDPLGFIIGDVARLIRKRFDERVRGIGATRAQWKTLFVLARNEGVNQGALADRLEVEPITLCRMIDRLEESGLVERRRDPGDRRAWLIYLTDAAKPLLDELHAYGAQLYEEALDGLDGDERAALTASLEKIRSNLNATPSQPEAANG